MQDQKEHPEGPLSPETETADLQNAAPDQEKQAPKKSRAKDPREPLSLLQWLWMLVILAIPVVNLIVLVKWAFGGNVNVNKKNFARIALILGVLAVAVSLALSFLLPAREPDPDDVPASWTQAEVAAAQENDLVPGSLAGDYATPLTREDAVALLVRVYEKAAGASLKAASSDLFSDTDNKEILKGASAGIVTVTPGTAVSFHPDGTVSRQEMAVFLLRTLRSVDPQGTYNTAAAEPFADQSEVMDWAQEAINFAYNYGIYSSYENRIAPTMTMTRDEGILSAWRLFEILEAR